MTKVDFLISGRAGFDALKGFVETFGTIAVNSVASYADNTVLNDPYNELINYCTKKSITFFQQDDYTYDSAIYRFVIGEQFVLATDEKTIVIHDSLLPRYRGYSPLINYLIKGEKETGVTAFIATTEMDEGPVIRQESIAINYPITINEAMLLQTTLYNQICSFIYQQLQNEASLKTQPQDNYLATYSLWRDELEYHINWNNPSDKIKRTIDALGFPYTCATALLNNEMITIKSAEIFGDVAIENRTVGKVIFIKDNCPVIVCGDGLIKITEAYFVTTGQAVIPFSKIKSRFH